MGNRAVILAISVAIAAMAPAAAVAKDKDKDKSKDRPQGASMTVPPGHAAPGAPAQVAPPASTPAVGPTPTLGLPPGAVYAARGAVGTFLLVHVADDGAVDVEYALSLKCIAGRRRSSRALVGRSHRAASELGNVVSLADRREMIAVSKADASSMVVTIELASAGRGRQCRALSTFTAGVARAPRRAKVQAPSGSGAR